MTTTPRIAAILLIAAAATLNSAASFAQAWPTKPIRVINPFPAGGGTDTFARPLAAKLSQSLGQQVLIENQGGAGGTLGANNASKAAPDGYTFFMGAVHHTIAETLYRKLPYSLERDFIPVTVVAYVPNVVVIHPKHPFKTIKELIDFAKANPGKLNFGSAGNGTSHHLAGELFKQQTQTFITHIPYRGAGPALGDLIAGNVDMMFDGLGSSAGHIKGGRIKALMVSGVKRNPAFPDVPCAAELGLPDYTVTTWYGLWAPKATPADVQARIVEEIRRAAATDELKATWASNGAEFGNLTPPQFGGFVSAEVKRWAAVVKASGAKLD